jgi:VWFA-related protein
MVCVAFTAAPTALCQSGAAAANQALPQSNVPTIKVTSRETLVDVTVTDAKGNPVHGLTREDFTVKEDGKVQPIRSFAEFDSEDVREPVKLPPNIYSNRQPPPASNAVNLLWLDFRNIPDLYQMRAKKEAKRYLQEMPAGTRVAILGSSGPTSFRIVQGVTADSALLSAAIDTLQYDTTSAPSIGEGIASSCSKLQQINQMTLESLNQIATDVAGIKGRKNLIWFMTGIPSITDPAWRQRCLTDCFPELKKAYGLLAAAQVAVFPIDPRGLIAPPKTYPQELLSMESVAEATGGAAFYSNNDLKAGITKAVETGSDYYTLTYVPPGTEYDGRHHTIHLEADQPGLHLTYRDEYYAEDPSKMTTTAGLTLATLPPEVSGGDMKAAMSRSMPTSSALLFYVDVEPGTTPAKPDDPPVMGTLDARFKDKPLTRYTFSYSISAGQLAYTNGPNATHNGSLELDLAAYDADAKLVTGLSQTITMSLNDTTVANKQPLNFSQQLDLPAGQLFVRIGVLDHTSNKVGTLEIPLTVGKKPATPHAAAAGKASN